MSQLWKIRPSSNNLKKSFNKESWIPASAARRDFPSAAPIVNLRKGEISSNSQRIDETAQQENGSVWSRHARASRNFAGRIRLSSTHAGDSRSSAPCDTFIPIGLTRPAAVRYHRQNHNSGMPVVPFNNAITMICCLVAALVSAPAWCDGLPTSTENVAIVLPSDQMRETDESQTAVDAEPPAQPNPATTAGTDTSTPDLTVSPSDADIKLANITPAPAILKQADLKPPLTTDTSLSQGDLWQRIRNGFAMPELDSSLIARHEQWYVKRPDYVARMTERARRYLYFITEEVEKRGMPTEIALLPIIESAFKPDAHSTSSAAGIWQFIPSTGKHFGLEQNWWHDERRDIIGATEGALDYLQKLHDQFGSWELALAAYNWGENAVERAQAYNRRHHRPTDYSNLRMPRETRNYVPKLLAVRNIVNDPAKFGLTLEDIPDRPYFAAVNPPHHMDVKIAAKLAEMPLDEFIALNPAHNRPVILQDADAPILLPVDKVDTFMSNVELYDKPLVSWQPYQPKKGERLDKLARRFDISVAELRSANGLLPYVKTSDGRKLLVPADNSDNTDNSDFEAFNTQLPPTLLDLHATVHVVRRGDTLGGIASRYHISVASLKRQNHDSTLIRPGQRLVVVAGAVPRSGRIVHVVRRGETLGSIAKRYHISLASLKIQNGNSTLIRPGQRLVIAGASSPTKAGRFSIAYNQ